jgi:hypothetical protein
MLCPFRTALTGLPSHKDVLVCCRQTRFFVAKDALYATTHPTECHAREGYGRRKNYQKSKQLPGVPKGGLLLIHFLKMPLNRLPIFLEWISMVTKDAE